MQNAAQQTQIDSYYSLSDVSGQQRQVYKLLQNEGALCDKQIAQLLGWDVGTVNARRNELFHDNKIEIARKAPSPFSGKQVLFWRIKKLGQQQFA